MPRLGAVLVAVLLACLPARAIILYGLGNDANTTAPASGVPFGSAPLPFDLVVGIVNGGGQANASGVYLGNGWVLTANHVYLEARVSLDGVYYNVVANSGQQIGTADLKLFRISNAPAASNIILNDDPLQDLNASSVFIGWGQGKGDPIMDGSEIVGWDWGGTGTIDQRWGTNTTSITPVTDGTTIFLRTIFDSNAGDTEAAVTLGDSGGGLFQWIDGEWRLAGIGAASNGQNPGASTEGDPNYFVRVATYYDQIMAIISVPEPGTGSLLAMGLAGWVLARRRRA